MLIFAISGWHFIMSKVFYNPFRLPVKVGEGKTHNNGKHKLSFSMNNFYGLTSWAVKLESPILIE